MSASPSWKRACGTGVSANRAIKAREKGQQQTLVVKMLLEQIGPDLWLAEDEPLSFHGFASPTRSVNARSPYGGVWVWSPIEIEAGTPGLDKGSTPVDIRERRPRR
jgi:hypothetical protein